MKKIFFNNNSEIESYERRRVRKKMAQKIELFEEYA